MRKRANIKQMLNCNPRHAKFPHFIIDVLVFQARNIMKTGATNLLKSVVSLAAMLMIQSCGAFAGEAEMTANKNPDSISKADREFDLNQVKSSGTVSERIESNLKYALNLCYVKRDKRAAHAYVDKALALYKATSAATAAPESYELALIAASYDVIGDKSNAAICFESVRTEWSGKNPKGDYLANLLDLATSSPMVLDSYSVSVAIAQEALRLANQGTQSDEQMIARILAYLGMLQEERGKAAEAIENLLEARTLLLNQKQPGTESKLFSVEFYLGKAYLAQKDYSAVEKLCSAMLAKEEAESFPDTKCGAMVALLAEVYYETKRDSAAKSLYEEWKTKMEKRSEHMVELLRAFSDLDSKRQGPKQYVIRKLSDDPTLFYELLAANKSLVNNLITHYYVLKECNLFHRANVCFGLETAFAKEADEHARPRELSGPVFEDRDETGIDKLTAEEKSKLSRSAYEVKRAYEAYQSFLIKTNNKKKIEEASALFETFNKTCCGTL